MFSKKNFNIGVGISSSILSLGVSLIGYANFQLEHWWQFILSIPILFVLFSIFVILIDLFLYCYERHVKRAHIRINPVDELDELEMIIDRLYEKEQFYQNCDSPEYKALFEYEVQKLYYRAVAKIGMLKEYHNSTIIKGPTKLPDVALFEKCCSACEFIKTQHSFRDLQ